MFSVRLIKLDPKNRDLYLFDKEGVAPLLPQIDCCFMMFVRKTEISSVLEIFESKPIRMVEYYPDEDAYEFVTQDGTYHLFIYDDKYKNLPLKEAA